MTVKIRHISFDAADPYTIAEFWSAATGFSEDPQYPNAPGDDETALISVDEGSVMLFLRVPEGKTVKNRVHLDLMPTDATRDDEVERLIGLGATMYDDRRADDGSGWVVLRDPEGNEFCVERSADEREQQDPDTDDADADAGGEAQQ